MRNSSFFLASHSCLDPAPREAAPGGGVGGEKDRDERKEGGIVRLFINPRRACAVRVTLLALCVCVSVCVCVCVCVCYSTSHFSRVYSCHK